MCSPPSVGDCFAPVGFCDSPQSHTVEAGNALLQADGLAMVEHGLNYLLNCYIKDPTDYGNAQGDIYIYQVGDLIKERRRWFRPEDVTVRIQHCRFCNELCARVQRLICLNHVMQLHL